MDPQNNKFANVNMKYSDKAKKVFYNIKLGKSPDREEKTDKIIQSFNEEGILAEPITDGEGKSRPSWLTWWNPVSTKKYKKLARRGGGRP